MASQLDLKIEMATSIFLTTFIFGALVFAVVFMLALNLLVSLIFAVTGTALFILFEYQMGPVMVKASTRLRYLKPGENPWLEKTVKELADKCSLPTPKLAIVPNSTPNAFTFGRSQGDATLAVHEGLLRQLKEDEVRSVIAHEMGHIKHKDYAVMTVLCTLPLMAYTTSEMALLSGTFSRAGVSAKEKANKNKKPGAGFILIGTIAFVIFTATFLVVLRLSRLREYSADAYSASVMGAPRELETALAKITYDLSVSPEPPTGARAFCICDPGTARHDVGEVMEKKNGYCLDRDGVLNLRGLQLAMQMESNSAWRRINGLFSTHAPTFKRILLLREIEQEIDTEKNKADKVYSHV